MRSSYLIAAILLMGAPNFAMAKVNLPPHTHSITDPLETENHQPSVSINGGN